MAAFIPNPSHIQLRWRWFRPLVLLSLGLHGLLLFLPMTLPGTLLDDEATLDDEALADPFPAAMQVSILPNVEIIEPEAPLSPMPPTPIEQAPAPPVEPPVLDIEPVEIIEDDRVVDEPPVELPPEEPPPEELPPAEPPPAVYSSSGTGTANQNDFRDEYTAWYQEIAINYQLVSLPDESQAPLTVIANSSQCRNPEPQTTSIGIVAGADGTIEGNPKLLLSSGYSDLNDQILAHVQTVPYPTDGALKSFVYEVEIAYEGGVCTANNASHGHPSS